MKKKISDYAPLYLGHCDVVIHEYNQQYSRLGWHIDKVYQFTPSKLMHFDDDCFEGYKLILRPLSDMTEQEADHFAWLCMNSTYAEKNEGFVHIEKDEIQIEFARNDDGLMLDGDVEIYIGISCRCFEGYVSIMKDGRIGICDEGDSKEDMKPVDMVSEKIHYLISRGFDLFNLIADKLAIEKT